MTSEAVRTELAIRDETSAVMLTNAQLQMIANTSFVPAAFRGKVPEVLACVATGRALGLPDMTALRGIHIIEGKATLSAELMDAIVRGHGHSITGTVDAQKAVAIGKRRDNGDTMQAEFTMEMAEMAGLLNRPSWKKHPDDMMWARAVSKLCRRLFADCFAGATYVPEEVEPTADELMDESVPFDSGELPLSEDEAQARGLAELEDKDATAKVSHPSASPSTAASVADAVTSEPASGSVSPWKQLVSLAAKSGVTTDAALIAEAKAAFPGRVSGSLTEDECNTIWRRIIEKTPELNAPQLV